MTSAALHTTPRPLFGGAISFPLPHDYIDASDLRQIPDNQEVFLSSKTDTSVIVEILGLVDEGTAATDLWEAAKYHFNSIAHDNAALSSTIITPPRPIAAQKSQPPQTPAPVVLAGTQKVHKYSHDPTGAPRPGHENDVPDEVWIGVALWRVNVDQEGQPRRRADVVCSVNVPASAGEEERAAAESWWIQAVGQLRIVDWGLFAEEAEEVGEEKL